MLKNLIKKADLLVDPYEFNISQKEKSLTTIGGVISLLLLVFTTFYIVGVFQRSIQNQNSIYAGTQSDENNNFILQQDNTIFALEISTLNGTILSNQSNVWEYFTLTAQYIQQQRVEGKLGFTRNYTTLNQTICSKEKVENFNFNTASMTEEQKAKLICFDGNFTLQGQFYEAYFAYIKLTLSVCNNKTSKCRTTDQITQFINSGVNLDLFIRGSKIKQSLNYTDPADTFSTDIFWRLTTGIGDNEDIYMQPIQMDLKKMQFFSDLFNIEDTESLFSGSVVQRQERRQEPISIVSGAGLCTFYLRASPDNSYYFVIQQGLPSILLSSISEATALCLAAMQIIKYFYKIYNQHKTFEVLMNSVFRFDLKSVQKRKESYVNSQTPGKFTSSTIKNTKGKLQEILDYTINYQFYKYLNYQFRKCCRKPVKSEDEKELIISQIAKSKIEFDLDLTNILKKLYEIDCLKLFLFDDDQLMLFNTFCAPVFQDQVANQKALFDMLMATNKQNRSVNPHEKSQVQSINQNAQGNDQIYQLAATSTIPINIRLASISRFFKAQLAAENAEDLVEYFKTVQQNKNKNSELNEKLIAFAKQNNSLFNLVKQNTQNLIQQQQEEMNIQQEDKHEVPNELDDARKSSDVLGSKESGQSCKDLEINISPRSLENRLQFN